MKSGAMGLFGKVFLLVIAEIVLIAACVYIHIDDLTPSKEVEKVNNIASSEAEKEKPVIEEPLKKMVKEPKKPVIPDNIKEAIKPTASKAQEKTQKPKKVEVKKEQKVVKTSKPTASKITDEKVKTLFEKKKETSKTVQTNNEKNIPLDESVIKEVESSIASVVKENRIIFKRLSTDVTEKSKQSIEKIAQILKQNPAIKIEVGGHTDAKGDDEVNAYISKQRALSVRKLLIKDGVNKERLTAKGYGESQPIVKNDPQGYSIQNRRVEFKVIKD